MNDILNLIGNTPLVEIKSPKEEVRLFAKLESSNPGGSVKDRAAYNMILQELKSGRLKSGDKIIEATSGNTGIALAMVANLLEVQLIIVLPEDSTIERIQTMKVYGAEVILTSASKGIEYSRQVAINLSKEKGYKLLNQFDNPNNWKAHYNSTGPEIWKDTNGEITHFVSAMGTTGTIMGVSKFLKERNGNIQIIGAQPSNGAKIPGIRKWNLEMTPSIYNPNRVDEIVDVQQCDAEDHSLKLARNESIFAGISSGGAYFSALTVISKIDSGCVVFVVCDGGDRYLSSGVFK